MQLAGVRPGMWVADVGAGEGYYTVRLARVVGPKGRVLAEDIMPEVTDQLTDRVQRQRLDNVAVRLGTPDDPMLPRAYVRPHLPRPHVPRGRLALRLPVALARRAEARRPRRRGRCQPPGKPPRHAARAAEMRVRGAEPRAEASSACSTGGEVISWRSALAGPRPEPERSSPASPRGSRAACRLVHVLAGEDQMIEQRAVERLGGGRQPARRPQVGIARAAGRRSGGCARPESRHVPCRAASTMISRSGKFTPQASPGMARQMEAARLLVEVRDPKALLSPDSLRRSNRRRIVRAAEGR